MTDIIKFYLECKSISKTASFFKKDRRTISSLLKKNNIKIVNYQNEQTIYSDYFENIDTEEKAYWLGFMFADGYVSSKTNNIEISLKSSDYKHLEKFQKCINHTKDLYIDEARCRLCFASKKMKSDLISHGCIPNKSLILSPPLNIPDSLLKHFIRGYFDGDGSIGFSNGKKYSPSFSLLGTIDFLNFASMVLLGECKKLRSNHGSEFTFVLDLNGGKARTVLFYLYNDANIYLDRKFYRYQEFKTALYSGDAINVLSKYGGVWDDNTVVNLGIAKGPKSPYSVGGE